VPRYIEHFEDGGALYLVMEKVEGESLEAIRKREGALPEAEVRRFLACADRALTYLHGRGSPVVHRDVKPGNVIRRPDGSYVLVDFGAVSEFLLRRGSSTIVGTMGYMAPEQLQGRALAVSDVYAVGATALATLTGVEPETLPHKGLRVDVRAAVQGRASPELILSLERMLEPDPDERAPSVAAALDFPSAGARSPSSAPSAARPVARVERTSEDAIVKSIRRLLWTLWGLGWVLVPMVFGKVLGVPEAIPIIMFGWLAFNLIVAWHRGALLRGMVRWWNAEQAAPHVHTSELRPEDVVAGTEVQTADEAARRRAP
jgi:serine/threonine protein kinase